MSSRRSKLFNSLRLFFWSNVTLFCFIVCWSVYLRNQRSNLLDVVDRQLAYNIRLSSDLALAHYTLTNYYFNVSSSFVSNFVVDAVNKFSSRSFVSSAASSAAAASSPDSSSVDLPDFSFRGYFEVNGVPYIRLRNQVYRRGDIVLGFPIDDISPDIVLYRGKYYKVLENEK